MTNETVCKIETHIPINFTSATAIEKGAILKMTSPMTAALADGDNDIIAGIAQSEVSSTDTSVSVYRGGVFRDDSDVKDGIKSFKELHIEAYKSCRIKR